jgi:hypothetical protein
VPPEVAPAARIDMVGVCPLLLAVAHAVHPRNVTSKWGTRSVAARSHRQAPSPAVNRTTSHNPVIDTARFSIVNLNHNTQGVWCGEG